MFDDKPEFIKNTSYSRQVDINGSPNRKYPQAYGTDRLNDRKLLSGNVDIRQGTGITPDKFRFILEKMDIMEIILITLSMIPLVGWSFDFFIAIYALKNKNLKLALITLLGWIIFGFGPAFKSFYLFDKTQQSKNILSKADYNYNRDYEDLKKVGLQKINGLWKIVDNNNNVYEPVIRNAKKIGTLSSDRTEIKKL